MKRCGRLSEERVAGTSAPMSARECSEIDRVTGEGARGANLCKLRELSGLSAETQLSG